MAKTSKKSVSIKNNLVPKDILNKINLKLVLLFIVLTAGLWAVYRFGNVAVVNGKYISRIEYIKNMEKQVGKQTLDQMVTETLIQQEAIKKEIKVEQSEIDTEIAKIDEQIKSQGQTLEAALAAEGMSRGDLEKQIRIKKLVDILSDPKTEVTEDQIKDFLTKNKDLLPKGASKTELNDLAKEQLESQIKSEALNNWLSNLKKEAKIIYR